MSLIPLQDISPLAGSRKRAFSLVEVTIALGLVSMAVVVVLGLQAAGLNTLRDAISDNIGARISQAVTQTLSLAEFGAVQDSTFYFDGEGNQAETADQVVYEVSTSLVPIEVCGEPLNQTSSVRGVRLIIYRPGNEASPLYERTFLIAHSGKI